MIRKRGRYYYVLSHKKSGGKRRSFGKYRSRKAAQRRLRQISFFKHKRKR